MADSYGLTAKNDLDVVTIDSEFSRLCIFHKGRYSGAANSVYVGFQNVVTSQEPPLIFLRPDNNGSFVQAGCVIYGAPGAWTGTAITGTTTVGSIMVAAFASATSSDYGMRLRDGSGKQLFDSGAAVAVFTRAAQNWTYTHTTYSQGGAVATNWYAFPLSYESGDYLMINTIRMWMMSGNNGARQTGLRFDFAAGLLRISVTDVSNPIYFSFPALFAKPNN